MPRAFRAIGSGSSALVAAAALCVAGLPQPVLAAGPANGTPPPVDAARLDLRVEAARRPAPRAAPAAVRAPTRASPAASLPDPRALQGGAGRGDEARLRLNLKGFSLLEMRESQGARFQVRRIREREWRRPALSVTLQKRF